MCDSAMHKTNIEDSDEEFEHKAVRIVEKLNEYHRCLKWPLSTVFIKYRILEI